MLEEATALKICCRENRGIYELINSETFLDLICSYIEDFIKISFTFTSLVALVVNLLTLFENLTGAFAKKYLFNFIDLLSTGYLFFIFVLVISSDRATDIDLIIRCIHATITRQYDRSERVCVLF